MKLVSETSLFLLNMHSVTVAVSDSVETSAVQVTAAEAAVCDETCSSSADDDNIWTKPLPVTQEKSRSAAVVNSWLCVHYQSLHA